LFEKAYGYTFFSTEKAVEQFDIFLKRYPESSAKDSVLFWKAKSLVQMDKPAEAKKIFSEFQGHFTDSPFRDFALKELESLSRSGPLRQREDTDAATLKEES